MKVPSIGLQDIRRMLDKNSPVILTGMAVVGTFATAYYTYKGTQKGTQVIRENEPNDEMIAVLSNQEKFLLTYKFYIPAATAVVGTSACMIMATKIGLNRTAALGAALVIAERGNEQYKDKVKELLGENKHIKVTDEIAKDQVAAVPSSQFPLAREGEQIFLDAYSGRTLSTTRNAMDRAVNDINQEMIYGRYCSLSEFYSRIGLEDIQESDSIGWNNKDLVELVYTSVLKDDRAVVVFTFNKRPSATFRDADI